jgi:hypothetical protein
VKGGSVARPRTDADEPEQAADTSEAKGEQKAQEATGSYTVERLIAESDAILDQPSHVVAGALHESEPSEEMSVSAAKQKVEEFLTHESPTSESDETQA